MSRKKAQISCYGCWESCSSIYGAKWFFITGPGKRPTGDSGTSALCMKRREDIHGGSQDIGPWQVSERSETPKPCLRSPHCKKLQHRIWPPWKIQRLSGNDFHILIQNEGNVHSEAVIMVIPEVCAAGKPRLRLPSAYCCLQYLNRSSIFCALNRQKKHHHFWTHLYFTLSSAARLK